MKDEPNKIYCRKYCSGKFDRSVSLLAFAYNEEKLLNNFLKKAFAMLDETVIDYELILVDDGSKDHTAEIAAAYRKNNSKLRIITHERNMGIAQAIKTAISAASKEFLFWQTVDWAYDLTNIRKYLELFKRFDVLVGIRPYPIRLLTHIPVVRNIYRVKDRSDNLKKALISLINYFFVRLLYGVPFSDFQNVHFYPTALLRSFPIKARSSFISPEMLIKSYWLGKRFVEVPIAFMPRKCGESKGTNLKAIMYAIRDIVLNWFQWGAVFRFSMIGKKEKRIWRINELIDI